MGTAEHSNRVLIVDDDPVILDSLSMFLKEENWETHVASSGAEALHRLRGVEIPFVITDLAMPGMSGLDLLTQIKETHPETEVIVMTGKSNEDFAIRALRAGAADYFRKPIQGQEILGAMFRCMRISQIKAQATQLQALVDYARATHGAPLYLGDSAAWRAVVTQLETLARSPELTVLLTGESGTGKEVAARMLHRLTHPEGKPYVGINCGGISDSLLERELFGHERGAFTGAEKRTPGIFELGLGGTVLLDEISEMNPAGQSRFLRVLEERSFRRLGGTSDVHLKNTRIVAATNRDLTRRVAEGLFREDLYFRLNVVPVRLPALRERREDIVPLARHLLNHFPAGRGKHLSPQAERWLEAYPFPGNIRELRNLLERAAVFSPGEVVGLESLPIVSAMQNASPGAAQGAALGMAQVTAQITAPAQPDFPASETLAPGASLNLDAHERRLVAEALARHGSNRAAAARALGITPQSLYRRLEKFKLP